jgi:hypothetical protein
MFARHEPRRADRPLLKAGRKEKEYVMASPFVVLIAALQVSSAAPAAPASAATAAPMAPAAADAAAEAPQDPMVCRRVDVSGSPFSKKECHHLSTWNKMARSGEM